MPESIIQAVFLVFIVSIAIQMLWYLLVLGRLAFFRNKTDNATEPPVSVVICARNEYLNLEKFLPQILEQDYPEFEVVVVNDRSEDDSIFLLSQMKQKYPHLSIVDFKQDVNFFKGKKFPLSVGIKSAKHDLVLLTDADCYPSSKQWIRQMAAGFDDTTDIVLGYGAYEKHKGLLNAVIRYDTLRIGASYLSAALWKIPYMGIGRNLAYRKSLFYENNGFSSHYRVASGDDDLFINKAAKDKNTRVVVSKDARTISVPKTTWKGWWAQKKRHLSTSIHYKWSSKLFLAFKELPTYSIILSLIPLAILQFEWITVLSLVVSCVILKLIVSKRIANTIGDSNNLLLLLPLEAFLLIVYPLLKVSNLIRKQDKWK